MHTSTTARAIGFGVTLFMAVVVGLPTPAGAAPTELFISEYVEGSSNNKAIEIYNGTGAAIDLTADAYALKLFFNGSITPATPISLSSSIAPGDTFVVAHCSAVPGLLALADMCSTSLTFNGDDAVVLYRGAAVIDTIGQVGLDPGAEWGAGVTSTADNTLQRKPSVLQGDTVTGDLFDPSIEWIGLAIDTFSGLGTHTVDGTIPPPDTDRPIISHSGSGTVGAGGWFLSSVSVTLGCTDPTSPVASLQYRIGAGALVSYTAPFTVSTDGTTSISVVCADTAGNATSVAFTVKIDRVAPAMTVALSGPGGERGWYRGTVTTTLTCTDVTSGPGPISYAVDGAPSAVYGAPFQVDGEGAHVVAASCRDVAGNTSATRTADVRIDRTAPTGTLTAPAAGVMTYDVAWQATDTMSGIADEVLVQESATLLGSGFSSVCTTPASGASASGSCSRSPVLPNRYCYRIVVSDLAGNTLTTPGTSCTLHV